MSLYIVNIHGEIEGDYTIVGKYEPCEDCVSREAVIELLKDLEQEDIKRYGCKIPEGFDAEEAVEAVRKLSSVTPKQRRC